MNWQLAEAKNRFSEVVDKTTTEGPQVVTRRGENVAVVISFIEYQRLTVAKPNFYDYVRTGPSLEGVDLDRDPSPPRIIEF